MLILSQSAKIGGGTTRKGKAHYLDQGPFVRRALQAAQQIARDPLPLLQPDYDLLQGMDDNLMAVNIRHEQQKWCQKPKNKILLEYLFKEIEQQQVQEAMLPVLRSEGAALQERFMFGDFKKFHEGGEHFDAAESLSKVPALAHVPINTDSIERHFGVYSDKKKQCSGNTDPQVVAGLACYVGNHTGDWLRSLTISQMNTFITLMRRKARAIAKEGPMGRDVRKVAAHTRLDRSNRRKTAAKIKLRNKVKKHIKLRQAAVDLPDQLNLVYFDNKEQSTSAAACLRYVKQSVNVLITCYGMARKDLIAYRLVFTDMYSIEMIDDNTHSS